MRILIKSIKNDGQLFLVTISKITNLPASNKIILEFNNTEEASYAKKLFDRVKITNTFGVLNDLLILNIKEISFRITD